MNGPKAGVANRDPNLGWDTSGLPVRPRADFKGNFGWGPLAECCTYAHFASVSQLKACRRLMSTGVEPRALEDVSVFSQPGFPSGGPDSVRPEAGRFPSAASRPSGREENLSGLLPFRSIYFCPDHCPEPEQIPSLPTPRPHIYPGPLAARVN